MVSIRSRQEGVTSFVDKTEPWCSKGFSSFGRDKLPACVHVRHGWDRDGAMEGSSGNHDKPKGVEGSRDLRPVPDVW